MTVLTPHSGVIAASRRRAGGGGAPAILGYNIKGASLTTSNPGRKYVTKATLAAAATLTELHGWFKGASGENIIILIYADSAGAPGARVAYTAPFALTGSDQHLQQTGFSVSLPAGTYWIGWVGQNGASGAAYQDAPGPAGCFKGIGSGAAFNPPSDPFGTPTTSSPDFQYSCWAVVI
jgi:hypothetical protein